MYWHVVPIARVLHASVVWLRWLHGFFFSHSPHDIGHVSGRYCLACVPFCCGLVGASFAPFCGSMVLLLASCTVLSPCLWLLLPRLGAGEIYPNACHPAGPSEWDHTKRNPCPTIVLRQHGISHTSVCSGCTLRVIGGRSQFWLTWNSMSQFQTNPRKGRLWIRMLVFTLAFLVVAPVTVCFSTTARHDL